MDISLMSLGLPMSNGVKSELQERLQPQRTSDQKLSVSNCAMTELVMMSRMIMAIYFLRIWPQAAMSTDVKSNLEVRLHRLRISDQNLSTPYSQITLREPMSNGVKSEVQEQSHLQRLYYLTR
jgi:hypothetical protein